MNRLCFNGGKRPVTRGYSLRTFSTMVQEAIKKKEGLIDFIKNKEAEAGNDLHFPDEILKKLGKDPEFSKAEYWRISATIKKLGLIKAISPSDWAELELIEVTAKNSPFRKLDKCSTDISNNKGTDVLIGCLQKIKRKNQENLKRLIRWCTYLYFLEKNINEQAFYDKCMIVGELLVKKTIMLDKKLKKISGREKRIYEDIKSDKVRAGNDYPKEPENKPQNGFGGYSWPDGSRYVGEWKNASMHGQGTYTFPDGGKYVGEVKNNMRHGQGRLMRANGSKYEGEWKNDLMHGQGIYIYPDGCKHTGEWKNGFIHGYGISRDTNGDKYEGEWKEGKIYGWGTYTFSDGTQFVGEWKDGKRHGQGLIISLNGKRHIVE